MSQLERCMAMMQPVTVMASAVLMLGLSSPSGPAAAAADASTPTAAEAAPVPDPSAEPTPDAAAPRVRRHGPAKRMTVAQSIDEGVRRLAHGLDLDSSQQVRLRQILVDQHQRMMQLRNRDAAASGEAAGAMMAIYDQTRARIRSMLNEEQLKKYPGPVPRDQTAPAKADLGHWVELQEAKRRRDAEVSP